MPRRSPSKHRCGTYFLDQRPNSPNWCLCHFDRRTGQTKRESLGTKDVEEAKRLMGIKAVERERPHFALPENVRIVDVLTRYHKQHAQSLPSGQSIEHHNQHIVEHFDVASVADLTPFAQDDFRAELVAKGLSAGYIRRILGTLRAALNRAYRRQEIASVPFIEMPKDAGPERQARKLEPVEVARLLETASAGSDRLLLFCLIGLGTLARPDAIYGLRAEQIDFDGRLIRLNPPGRAQTKKHRPVVPLVAVLVPWLRRAVATSASGRLIEYRGQPVKSLKKAFGKAVVAAGLPTDVTPYSLRHTMARELRRRGVGSWELGGIMGHKQEATTEIYAEYSPDYRAAAAEAIESYFREVQTLMAGRLSICISPCGQRANNVRVSS